MSHLVAKGTELNAHEWDVRHTVDGKWSSVTTRGDDWYGNAFNCAEEVFDGQRWRPISDVATARTGAPNGWEKLEFSLLKG